MSRAKIGTVPEHRPDLGPCLIYDVPWTNNGGYASIFLSKKSGEKRQDMVHRVAWSLDNGPIPKGLEVLHACDNKLCIRASHLSVDTHARNMKEAWERNRCPRGEKSGTATLKESDVVEIKEMHKNGIDKRAIANRFQISVGHVGAICRGDRWAHVH